MYQQILSIRWHFKFIIGLAILGGAIGFFAAPERQLVYKAVSLWSIPTPPGQNIHRHISEASIVFNSPVYKENLLQGLKNENSVNINLVNHADDLIMINKVRDTEVYEISVSSKVKDHILGTLAKAESDLDQKLGPIYQMAEASHSTLTARMKILESLRDPLLESLKTISPQNQSWVMAALSLVTLELGLDLITSRKLQGDTISGPVKLQEAKVMQSKVGAPKILISAALSLFLAAVYLLSLLAIKSTKDS